MQYEIESDKMGIVATAKNIEIATLIAQALRESDRDDDFRLREHVLEPTSPKITFEAGCHAINSPVRFETVGYGEGLYTDEELKNINGGVGRAGGLNAHIIPASNVDSSPIFTESKEFVPCVPPTYETIMYAGGGAGSPPFTHFSSDLYRDQLTKSLRDDEVVAWDGYFPGGRWVVQEKEKPPKDGKIKLFFKSIFAGKDIKL